MSEMANGSEHETSLEEIKSAITLELAGLSESFNLSNLAEAVGSPDQTGSLAQWDQSVETEIRKLENNSQQVRAEIFFKIVEAIWFLKCDELERCISTLSDASENAYNQAAIPGFEDLDDISTQIDAIAGRLKPLLKPLKTEETSHIIEAKVPQKRIMSLDEAKKLIEQATAQTLTVLELHVLRTYIGLSLLGRVNSFNTLYMHSLEYPPSDANISDNPEENDIVKAADVLENLGLIELPKEDEQ